MATLKDSQAVAAAAGLVIPAMVRVAVVLLFRAQPAPARVMVTTPRVALAVAVQLVNPVPKVTVGVAGTVKFGGKCRRDGVAGGQLAARRGGEAHAPGGEAWAAATRA